MYSVLRPIKAECRGRGEIRGGKRVGRESKVGLRCGIVEGRGREKAIQEGGNWALCEMT